MLPPPRQEPCWNRVSCIAIRRHCRNIPGGSRGRLSPRIFKLPHCIPNVRINVGQRRPAELASALVGARARHFSAMRIHNGLEATLSRVRVRRSELRYFTRVLVNSPVCRGSCETVLLPRRNAQPQPPLAERNRQLGVPDGKRRQLRPVRQRSFRQLAARALQRPVTRKGWGWDRRRLGDQHTSERSED